MMSRQSSVMWKPVTNTIFAECRFAAAMWKLPIPSQYKSFSAWFDIDLSTDSTKPLRYTRSKQSSCPSFVYATDSFNAGTPQGQKGDRWKTLASAFFLPQPVSTIQEQVVVPQCPITEDWVTAVGDGSGEVFDNSVKIKSIYSLLRIFWARFVSKEMGWKFCIWTKKYIFLLCYRYRTIKYFIYSNEETCDKPVSVRQ